MATEAKLGRSRRGAELKVFLLLAGLLVPLLSIVSVGGFGLAVWTYQMIAGPPGSGTPPAVVRPTGKVKS